MKRKILILVCVFLVILIANFVFLIIKKESTEMLECKEFQYPLFKLICKAYKEKNIERCDHFKALYKELCAKAVFSEMEVNISFCKNYTDRIYKNICLMKLALQTGNYKYCPNDWCKFLINTPDACENIKNDILRGICLAKIYKDERYCLNLPADEHEKKICTCLINKDEEKCKYVLMKKSDPKKCEILIGVNEALCVSLSAKNIKDCEIISTKEEKELCKLFYITKIFYGSDIAWIYTEY